MNRNSTYTNQKINKLQGQYLASDLNRVWTIDITIISNKFFFFFIMDLASRRIIHHSVSEHDFNSLEAVEILSQAIALENNILPHRPVQMVHTDSGGIFLSHNWIQFLHEHHIDESSADSKRNQNQVSERFNKTFKRLLRDILNKRLGKKNNKTSTLQLIGEATQYNFNNVKKLTQEIVLFYNSEKPHQYLGMLTPDTWALQARNTPSQAFLIKPKENTSDDPLPPFLNTSDQNILTHIKDLQELSKNSNLNSNIIDIEPQVLLEEMKNLHKNFSIVAFDPLTKNDNSEKALQIREYRHQIIAKGIRDSINIQGLPISTLDQTTQDSFKVLEAENKKWEETEVRALQTIMLQNQILLTSIEDLKKQLQERDQRIEAQNQTILNQNDYLVKVTQQNEHVKQLAQERKLKRLTAKRQQPLDCLTMDEFYKILFEIIPTYKKNSYVQSRMRIGLFIMYFTGLRVSNLLVLTVKQIEELMQSEFGTNLVISKQSKSKPPKSQTIALGEDARNLIIDVFYDDVVAVLRNKSKQAAVFSKQGEELPLCRETWNAQVNEILNIASVQLNKNLKSHSFRITFATDGLNNQIPLLQMKSMLSHKSVSTTQHYVRHELSKPEFKNVITLANKSRVNQFHIKLRESQERILKRKETLKTKKTLKNQDTSSNKHNDSNNNNSEN